MTHFKAFAKLTAFSRLKNYSVCDINHGIGSKGISYFDYSFLTPGFSILSSLWLFYWRLCFRDRLFYCSRPSFAR